MAALVVFAAACGGSAGGSAEEPQSTPAPVRPEGEASVLPADSPATPGAPLGIDLDAVPDVDLSHHAVPLEEIVFDTFDGGFVRLSVSTEGLRRSLRDVIRPIYDPRYGDADALPWLEDSDLVLGYAAGDVAFAYPIRILNFRELVNDEIGGIPVLISYCPLCASGVVYDRRLDGDTLVFGNTSALFESDLVMFDHGTGSYWFQVGGEAIVGDLAGNRLDALPSTVAAWVDWERLHPNTQVLIGDADEVYDGRIPSGSFEGYAERLDEGRFAFPVPEDRLDDRLRASELVVTVEAGSAVKAYPLELIGDAVVNDELGGLRIGVFVQTSGFATAFLATAEGQQLTFDGGGGVIVDRETGSTWNAAGLGIGGQLEGAQLEPLPTRRGFWFSIALAYPGIDLFLP